MSWYFYKFFSYKKSKSFMYIFHNKYEDTVNKDQLIGTLIFRNNLIILALGEYCFFDVDSTHVECYFFGVEF